MSQHVQTYTHHNNKTVIFFFEVVVVGGIWDPTNSFVRSLDMCTTLPLLIQLCIVVQDRSWLGSRYIFIIMTFSFYPVYQMCFIISLKWLQKFILDPLLYAIFGWTTLYGYRSKGKLLKWMSKCKVAGSNHM